MPIWENKKGTVRVLGFVKFEKCQKELRLISFNVALKANLYVYFQQLRLHFPNFKNVNMNTIFIALDSRLLMFVKKGLS